MRPDQMTKKERISALLNGQPVDHVAFYPFILGFSANNVGYPLSTIYSDPQKSFEAQLWTQEQYGFDWGPVYGYASYGGWEFGGEVKMPEGSYEQAPSHTTFPVQSESDVDKMALPDIKTAGCIPLAMEFSRLQEKDEGTVISVTFGGNFTIAGNICPVERLCRWMIKKPDLVHRILRLATDHIIDIVQYWVDTFGDRVVPQIWEPLACNDIISPKQFEDFVLPYMQESGQKILDIGVKNIFYHICGEQNANLPYWAQMPMGKLGICSIGSQIKVADAIEHLGNMAIIAGNIEPHVMQTAPHGHIYELCREAIETGKKAPNGFMLMSGCEVPPATPPYNVYIMRKAIDDFGWYA